MTHQVRTSWKKDLAFDSNIDGHTIRIDSTGAPEDNTGPGAKKLLLSSLSACTGIDVVSILSKMRVPFTGLELEVEADLTEEHPKVYSEIRLIYKVYGENLSKEKVEKAVKLSKEKYCGVSAMLEKNCPILFSIVYPNDDSRVK